MALRVLLYCYSPTGTVVKLFFSLKSEHVARMTETFFSEVPVINKLIFGMILITSKALLAWVFSANEVIYFECCGVLCFVFD